MKNRVLLPICSSAPHLFDFFSEKKKRFCSPFEFISNGHYISPRLFSPFHCHFRSFFFAMENNQSSSNNSGGGVSKGGRMCYCGATIRMYTSWTKMNHGRRFLRCGGVVTHAINLGLLVRVNHLDVENRRMEAENRSLNVSISNLKAANLALLHMLKLVKIFALNMPHTRSQRAEMFACFDGRADHEEAYFIGRLQAAARERDIRDVGTLTNVCCLIAIQMSASLGRRFSLPSLKYKLARIRKDYHWFNGFLSLVEVDYDQSNNIVQIFPNIYWSEINPHSEPGCYRHFRTHGMLNYQKLSPDWPIHVYGDEEDLRAIVPIHFDIEHDVHAEAVVEPLLPFVPQNVANDALAIVPYVDGNAGGVENANGGGGGGGMWEID
ncbi:hypothetical protein ACJIZ3_003621 [Penstemon smallii]|uniref:Zinc finger GRF-type domain-containing protein n=1 Tax=Penstemon smallii TaxID=265156 RepID=A0ABD3UCG4_9LAMI